MEAPLEISRCPGCAMELAPLLLACPSCHRLVHADELRRLAAQAQSEHDAGRATAALTAWRGALKLLPENTQQHHAVTQRIAELGRTLDSSPLAPPPPPGTSVDPVQRKSRTGAIAATVAAIVLLLWKLKFVVVFALTKLKLLFFGLTKLTTFTSMLAYLGVYWAAWGWKFALGIVLSIYIHEMGHVAALQRLGIKATAPMFIPGLGALIRLKEYPATPVEDARVGLAGPLWGLAAAVVAYAVSLATGWPSWAAIAKVGAWINLFNLLPIWQLDGGRGFKALSILQRFTIAVLVAALWYLTKEGMLLLIAVIAIGISVFGKPPERGDRTALIQFAFLVTALTALSTIHIPGFSV